MDVAALPSITTLHRLAMFAIKRSGRRREQFLDLYRRCWRKLGPVQTGTTYFGAKFDARLEDRVPRTAFLYGFWEPNISHLISSRIAPGDIFVDVGSNFGYYSMLASKLVGPSGGVIAIEASPSIHKLLRRSLDRNRCANVRTVNAAVSDAASEVTIYAGPSFNTGATSLLQSWRNGVAEATVAAMTLDDILTPEEASRVRLIKIDVEGAELPILRQILSASARYPEEMEIVVEFSPDNRMDEWRQTFDEFLQAGFFAYAITNDYAESAYLTWRKPDKLQLLDRVPMTTVDLLLSRAKITETALRSRAFPLSRQEEDRP